MITSRIDAPSNPRIVEAVRSVKSGALMLLEGRRMIEEALDAGIQLREVFVQSDSEERREEEDFLGRVEEGGAARATSTSTRIAVVAPRVIRRLSDLPSTRGVVALAEPPHRTLSDLSSSFRQLTSEMSSSSLLLPSKKSSSLSPSSLLFLLLDDVQDPANVGAILRSAEAFGAAAALLTPGCASSFSPRALRASAGSAFRLPTVVGVEPGAALDFLRARGCALAGAVAHGGSAPEDVASIRPLALVIGSEGHGISRPLDEALDHRVTLPLAGRVESLNAAVAAGVLLHVVTRGPGSPR